MKKIFAAALMSGSAATAVFGAAPAQADSYQDINAYAFLKTIRENGITGSNDVLLGWGRRVCADLHAGYSPSQISRAVWLNTGIAEERDALSLIHI
ncbi:MAG: DUF732 domain-containing protein, partial [Mycobacterium sp.]|nr:DUF732 domain-containing protein [Mycobacterium sp.]